MRSVHLPFNPILIVIAVLAVGALTLGAATLGDAALGSNSPKAASQRGERAGATSLPLAAAAAIPGKSCVWFPSLYEPGSSAQAAKDENLEAADRSETLKSEAEREALVPALANNSILAFYGKPDSKSMGILGEYPKDKLAAMLKAYAKLYDDKNGDAGVVPAFYLIYGTCWPGGEIGYLKDSVVQEYIDYAAQQGMLVIVDHQIGKYPVCEAMNRLLPWLKYPNVHLALDPEWRTESPMKEIGTVSAEEVNAAEAAMSSYLESEGLPGARMLVIHQFQYKMISQREKVKADYDKVLLVHTADGFGSPTLKRATYANNAKATNMPLKGFKLFFKSEVEGAGYDYPLLLPEEVLALDPRPSLVIYQ
jgi:hypothetical protein